MEILFSQEEIARRVAELGREITEFYRGKPLLVIAIANGGIVFASDLVRQIDLKLEMDTLAVASYVNDKPSGEITFRAPGKLPVAGKHVLLVDDVLDSGTTLRYLVEYFQRQGAASCRTAVAVDKDVPRPADVVAHADWQGFTAPNRYLVGYGMDSDEYFRNLPYIAAID